MVQKLTGVHARQFSVLGSPKFSTFQFFVRQIFMFSVLGSPKFSSF